ncbi:vesicle-associated membrane [Cryptosporidium sp. chipmunk genotype I]|uniref:vesicle-associated membrane n=1 Tax=Cryptosporidium sp. chipmunk genotype I TaxID=1280935 RepID=UPI00351A2187|nr:vesicle-associated membrane [Cryptosporidium sp. chipmunk genotype I]
MSMEGAKLVRVHPEKALEFPLVLYSSVTTPLILENITSSTVAFKIKTTAPRGYLVRPSSGLIQAGQSKEIQVILQPLQSVEQASPSHRFLIQTTTCDSSVEQLTKDFWQDLSKEQLFEHRLSVIFKQENMGVNEPLSSSVVGASSNASQVVPTSLLSSGAGSSSSNNAQAGSMDSEFKNKYDELVQYCLALEKQSNELKEEVVSLREKLDRSESKLKSSNQGNITQGFEFWHIIAMIIVAILALKLINYF